MVIDHIGEMRDMKNDLIRREDALDCFCPWWDCNGDYHEPDEKDEYCAIKNIPAVDGIKLPDKEKISDALYHMYMTASPFASAEGTAAIKYYSIEIYREIFGEEGPKWMKK